MTQGTEPSNFNFLVKLFFSYINYVYVKFRDRLLLISVNILYTNEGKFRLNTKWKDTAPWVTPMCQFVLALKLLSANSLRDASDELLNTQILMNKHFDDTSLGKFETNYQNMAYFCMFYCVSKKIRILQITLHCMWGLHLSNNTCWWVVPSHFQQIKMSKKRVSIVLSRYSILFAGSVYHQRHGWFYYCTGAKWSDISFAIGTSCLVFFFLVSFLGSSIDSWANIQSTRNVVPHMHGFEYLRHHRKTTFLLSIRNN